LSARPPGLTREIAQVPHPIRWGRRQHRRKQSQEDQAAASKLNFRRAIAAKRFLRQIVRTAIRLPVSEWLANIHRLPVRNLQPADRGAPRRSSLKACKARVRWKVTHK